MILPRSLPGRIDHTLLHPEATAEQVRRLCREAVEHRFRSVCVQPARVATAAECLSGTGVPVCSVAGFPLGAGPGTPEEAEKAVSLGAGEIDAVIPLGYLKDGDAQGVLRLLKDIVRAAAVPVKVILETCLLTVPEKILACRLAMEAGAFCVKTSTGFSRAGATVEDVALLRHTVGDSLEVKASGGIRTLDDALAMLDAGASILGTRAGVSILEQWEKRRPEG